MPSRLRVTFGYLLGIVVVALAHPTPASLAVGGAIAAAGEAIRLWASGHIDKTRSLADRTVATLSQLDLFEYLERAIKVVRDFVRDGEYIVEAGEVLIVDPNTGRAASGRRWQDGLHEAVEAREGLAVRLGTGRAAQVTVQNYLSQYPLRAGMTGTTAGAERELRGL